MSITNTKATLRKNVRAKTYEDTVTIAAGQSIMATGLEFGNVSLVGIYTPSGWTASDITFQVSNDGSTWYEMRDLNGNAYTIYSVSGGGYRPLPPADFVGPKWIKVRSGTSGSPVAQVGARDIILVMREI